VRPINRGRARGGGEWSGSRRRIIARPSRSAASGTPPSPAETQPLAAILPRLHGGAPVAVIEVPAHGEPESLLEVVLGAPAQLLPDARRVDRVAPVVARAVLDEGLAARVAGQAPRAEGGVLRRGPLAVENLAEPVHHLEVRPLVAAADVVLPARLSLPEREEDAAAVVLDVEPVADVAAVA